MDITAVTKHYFILYDGEFYLYEEYKEKNKFFAKRIRTFKKWVLVSYILSSGGRFYLTKTLTIAISAMIAQMRLSQNG
jgi:hypothetical protein